MAEVQTYRFSYPMLEDISDFDPHDFVEKHDAWLKDLVKPGEKIALSASGGVDSTVAGLLIGRVVGDDLYPFFIDDGCRRIIGGDPEAKATERIFHDYRNFSIIDISEKVIPALTGHGDGELKRKIFISRYKERSDEYIQEAGASWIADGTIAPDIRETDAGFKSQHNVGWSYVARKLEPLASLAKPQVRKVGIALGLPEEFAHRIPCPGPAQILRVVGSFNQDKLLRSQKGTDMVEQMVENYYMREHGRPYLFDDATGIRTPFQYFAVVLENDPKAHGDLTDLAHGILRTGSEAFEMKGARTTAVPPSGRRTGDPIYKPVAWLSTKDDVGYDELEELSKQAWEQMELPRIIYQIHNGDGSTMYLAGIRAVESADAAAARPVRFEHAYLHEMGEKVSRATGLGAVGYDISLKPPATIEFE